MAVSVQRSCEPGQSRGDTTKRTVPRGPAEPARSVRLTPVIGEDGTDFRLNGFRNISARRCPTPC